MKELYDIAQKYRAIGWNVIPLYSYSKNPQQIKWKEFQERMATEEEFENWFGQTEPTGIALITGRISGVVVLDEDAYKEGGLKVKVDTGMMSVTARNGRHHFFKYIEPIKSSGLKQGIYVEIKADGGIIVLPPSKVKLDDGSFGEYSWEKKCYPEDLMGITEAQLAPYRGDSTAVNVMELSGATSGNRHNNLRSIALSLFARFRKEEWNLAEEVIWREAEKTDPPHPASDVKRIIDDAKQFIATHNDKEVDEEIDTEPVLPNTINALVEERIEDRALEKIAPHTGWPELDKLIKGFVPNHNITFTGDTNVGKTTIACNFAEALRRQQKKTLYIALEPDVEVVEYLASVRLRKQFKDVTDQELYMEEGDNYIQVLLQRDIEKVSDLVKVIDQAGRYDLIVIDHIGYFVQSERDWIQQQSNIIKQLKFLAKTKKLCLMMIAHLRKPTAQGKKTDWVPTQNDISGSASFKQDSTEVMIAFRPKKESDPYSIQFADQGVLLVTKTKAGQEGAVPLFFEPGSAKVWSQEEALTTPDGREFLKRREDLRYQTNMQASTPWMTGQPEVDTGSED